MNTRYRRHSAAALVAVLVALLPQLHGNDALASATPSTVTVFSDASIVLAPGASTSIVVSPGGATFSSANRVIATVDAHGRVTAHATGMTHITASAPHLCPVAVPVFVAVPGPDTLIVPSAAVQHISRSTVSIAPTVNTAKIRAGTILVSSSSAGLLDRVTAIQRYGTTIVATLTPTTLPHAFPNFSGSDTQRESVCPVSVKVP
jgi:hypothetical protein